ncbi:DUF3298 and DUF4163 domain-containing protein [Candidatus Aerophobetes bacterium]|nr:DUF3298 and DUF4163 domain-containing protein [Candidatus Aerophobetes bacterium]
MKNRKFLVLSIGPVWLLSMVVLLASGADSKQPSISSLPVNIQSIQESDSFFRVQAEYPQFQTAGPDFNQEIATLISDKIDSFKKQSMDSWKARLDTMPADKPVPQNPEEPFEFIASWQAAQLNNKYLSLVIKIYYFSGGAHGNEEIHAFNYDMLQKKKIRINNFFDSSQEALKKISEISAQDIMGQLQSQGWKENDNLKEMVNQGTAPVFENFRNFNFDPHSLTIYFQRYQVAPGAVGSLTVRVSRQMLEQNSLQSDYLK